MHTRLVAVGTLIALSLISSCSGSDEQTADEAVAETTTSTIPVTLSATFTDTPASTLASAEDCHIFDLPPDKNGMVRTNLVGFPRPSVVQRPKILVLPFWFTDGEAPTVSLAGSLAALRNASRYFEQVSWGKASMIVETAPEELWLQIPRTAAEMGYTKDSAGPLSGTASPFIVLNYASPDLRLDDYDIVYLVGSPELIHWATAMMELDTRDKPIVGPGGTVKRAVLMTHNHGDGFLAAHELGHAWLNLWDLYSLQNGITDFVGMNRFDLMYNAGLGDFNANELSTWSKYLAGWIEPNQVRCITNAGTTTHFVSTNSVVSDLPKSVMVKISDTKVLVIDTWRKSEFNRCCNETIAYVIDASRMNGAGPYRLQGSLKALGDTLMLDASHLSTNSEWTFRPNEQLAISNVSITLLESDESGALVEVTVG